MSSSNTTILIRKSAVSGNTPVDLANGEIAINSADGRLFYSDPIGNILSISNQDTFGTINANSTLIIASNPTDTLSLVAGNNITISADGINKSITISSTATGTGTFADGSITSTSFTTDSTETVVVDSFTSTQYRSAKYEVQMTSGSNYHAIEMRVLHDGSLVYLLQYGEIVTNTPLGLFDAEIIGGSLNILFTPTNNITTIKLVRTAIIT